MFYEEPRAAFDWQKAISLNRDALIGIAAGLLALLVRHGADQAPRIPRWVHRVALRVLRPAESALRRLIVIAARGLVPPPVVSRRLRSRPKASGHVIRGKGSEKGGGRGQDPSSSPAFQLHDPRKTFTARRDPPKVLPRISLLAPDDPHLVPLWARPQPMVPRPSPRPLPSHDDGLVTALPLRRRLAALNAALDDLPAQAQRLVRWQARRECQQASRFVFATPLRPGLPPGYRWKPRHEVDHVLKECHWLAQDAMASDTS
jgi:hypothetical protein